MLVTEGLCIFEDASFDRFFPLALSRPVQDLPFGGSTWADRIGSRIDHASRSILCRQELARITALSRPDWMINRVSEGRILFVNSRLQPFGPAPWGDELEENQAVFEDGELLLAVCSGENARELARSLVARLSEDRVEERIGSYASGEGGLEKSGPPWPPDGLEPVDRDLPRPIGYLWDLVERNPEAIACDLESLAWNRPAAAPLPDGVTREGDGALILEEGVRVRPGTVLDTGKGPIRLESGAVIEPLCFLQGPLQVGPETVLRASARIYAGTTLGPFCKIGGEVGETLIAGYSNKQHDGFLGHSVLGSWINLGAGTNNSDLKNTYGSIRFHLRGRSIDTGRMFFGAAIGDHAKTGIGSLLNTGTYLGFASSLYGAEIPPKFVASYRWGSGTDLVEHDLDKAMDTARSAMIRRGVEMTSIHTELFRRVHHLTHLSGNLL